MNVEGSESKPKASIPMDNYGNAAQEFIRSRTAATSAAFFLDYLKPGMTLLDVGCGEGTITVGLAEIVAPGDVIGMDIASGTLQRARKLAAGRGLANIRFEEGSIYELPFPADSFDAVFSHALFEHLTDKPKAIDEILRVLKPGGIVGLKASDIGALICEPEDPLVAQFWMLFVRIRDEMGGDSQAGRRFCGLLRRAGFMGVLGSASYRSFGTLDSVQWFGDIFGQFSVDSPYATEWVSRGWADRETLEKIRAGWQVWARQPDAFAAEAWCEAIGWKP